MTSLAAYLGADITQGTVVRAGTHFSGGTIYRDQTSASIYSTPEIWLLDETGREHHFRARALDGTREGHALIVVCDVATGTLLRITNRDTRSTIDLNGLIPQTGAWVVIRAVFRKLFTIFLPAALGAMYLGYITGLSGTIIGDLVGFASNFLLLYCGYLGWCEARNKADKVAERRAALDTLFRQNGWISDKAA
ncbi:MAG: hypothetical protein EA339_08640 [Rhodobacteraceae bacterium]|nr:MAG: hypothetical protein EA339_08640 [Paracoccaceae bacterium]